MENIISERRANAWKTFWAQKNISKSKMKLELRIRILESFVFPVLTYGAQTWASTRNQTDRLEKTQNAMLRKILGICLKDKIKSKFTQNRMGQKVWDMKLKN